MVSHSARGTHWSRAVAGQYCAKNRRTKKRYWRRDAAASPTTCERWRSKSPTQLFSSSGSSACAKRLPLPDERDTDGVGDGVLFMSFSRRPEWPIGEACSDYAKTFQVRAGSDRHSTVTAELDLSRAGHNRELCLKAFMLCRA
ncbi:hypothetical protein BN2475_1430004 [Paraburkholderia ribeironis]|uniref:Uncharacterized protein n=1 Tax=Paraburkholderia ribeironis TaxID=1247936 RepID=A0A1N7SQA9_9BURK|nr:hypothetical protein BN2475_1430004 [Paraburkholderia ribeironis]